MEFDKSRIYTAVNAEELPIGSKCVFANTMLTLSNRVKGDKTTDLGILSRVLNNSVRDRFETDQSTAFSLAYLIEPPIEPQYEPFSDLAIAMDAIKKHGGWVQEYLKTGENQYLITAFNFEFDSVDEIFFNESWHSRGELFNDFFFADDGSPCGELVEE